MSSKIPILSFEDIKNDTAQSKLAEAVTNQGVFYLTDSGIVDDDHTDARETCVNFFINGSEAEKKAVTVKDPKIRRGFSGLEWESTASITEGKTYTDYSCCYSMGSDSNLFPNEAFKKTWQSYFDVMYSTSREVAVAVLKAVGSKLADADGLDGFDACDPLLRLRYFPDVPEHRVAEEEPLRMAPHYDLSILTLIHQTACANGFVSLQCEIDGEFVDVPTLPGSLLVFCGAPSAQLPRMAR